ncbi:nitrate- and nitrite sensing domain-containing protein [Streptantibioticus rubrisoli]|uniref:histidine kinase n=1 Tax=Streptantibioticus rubrisoli TaxID=1387313 RepID=A0ABT1PJP1_9ACTN|nr:nitrate- and nitrite sensing domain-containing protein [Streptantibioticus rubrisoli]MCQ4044458.1 nitrate- and nitrite sensing domain-containing protein [Streptantibioticus rubrisoli]
MQGRFKRDGGAAGDPEARDGAGRGPEPRMAPSAPSTDPGSPGTPATGQPGPKGGASVKGASPKGPALPGAPARDAKDGKSAKDTATSALPASGGDVQPPAPSGSQGKHASRMSMRNWSIRTRLVSLLALPVVAATTLGVLRIQDQLKNVDQLDHMKLLTEMTGHATKLADALQNERDSSAGPITSHHSNDDAVVAARQATDQQIQGFQDATAGINTNDSSLVGVRSTIIDITRQLQSLKQIRGDAYNQPQYISQTVSGYDQLINSLLSLSQDMAQATSNSDMIKSTRALAAFTAAKEYESIQRAVISAALANPSGPQLSNSDRLYAQTASDSENSEIKRFSEIYGPGSAELMKALDGGNVVITQADQYRDRVLQTQNGIAQEPKSYLDWYDQADTKMQEMSRIETELLDQMQQQALKLRSAAQQDALINGALILLVLGVSLVGAFVVARSMIRSLRRLQDAATDAAQRRLPELVKQLSESDPQDVDTSVEEIGINTRDEIGRVARAFDDVHREAVRLAAEQALLRGNVNAMFTNLSRRSQGLIQRQLSLISELESREADPDQLSNLFKLDHLATRMRRNGENLLVLAGEEPGRRWTRPVPLVDVLRAAASEVEQYERIELTAVPPTEVAGRVVNDLVHLLAELLENATSFSSPQTKVRVTGHALPDGRVLVEIHDTGIGLSPEDLSDINERLANPPTVDVSVSRRMGLFVVGRLSLRHGIRIQLRPSDSGGTTALVMLPVDLTQGGAKPAAGQGQGQGKRGGVIPPVPGGRTTAGDIAAARGASPEGGVRRAGQVGRGAQPGPQPKGQVPPVGPRPALTGNQDSGQDRPQQRTPSGLPTRAGTANPGAPANPQQQRPAAPTPAASGERPAPSWAAQQGADTPRGHDDVESTAQFERPAFPDTRSAANSGAQRPGYRDQGTGEFPMAQQPGYADNATTGEFRQPGYDGSGTGEYRQPGYDGSGTGEYRQPGYDGSGTGEYRQPGYDNASTGEYRQPQQAPATDFFGGQPAGSGSDVFGPRGRQVPPPRQQRPAAEPAGYEATAEFPAVNDAPRAQRQRRAEPQLPPAVEPMALPPADSPGDGRSPIFESLESDWFRQQDERDLPAAPQQQRQQPPLTGGPRRSPAQPTQPAPSAETTPEWQPSPNDERWRRAEQVREPASGGVTSSGLPRRVPRANLVPGTAEQTQHAGPQVSRAPDDVRGRLTNLRRGIQQGRSAGSGRTDGRGFGTGTSHQQER